MGKYALLIGNSDYQDGRLNFLNAPSADVSSFESLLRDETICGFDAVKPVNNAQLVHVQRELNQFFANRSPDDLMLVYYTGHGQLDSDGHLWLALAESSADSANIGSLEAEYLRKAMDKCASLRQVLVLDCCHSGAIEKEIHGDMLVAKDGATRMAVFKSTFDPEGYGRYVLASSSSTQRSYEIGKKSLFTRAIVEGLREGSAAPEKTMVSLLDIASHAKMVLRQSGVAMTPFFAPGEQELSKLIIARNPRPRRSISEDLVEALVDASDIKRRLGSIELLKELAIGKDAEFYRAQVIELFSRRLDEEEHVKVHGALTRALDGLQVKKEAVQEEIPERLHTLAIDTSIDLNSERSAGYEFHPVAVFGILGLLRLC